MNSGTWFDVIIICLALAIGIKGLLNGFVREIFGLVGLIGGGIVASRTARVFGEFVSTNACEFTGSLCDVNSSLSYAIGLGSAWLLFWIACLILGKIVSKMVSMSGFGAIDRILGFIAGGAKIFLIFAIVFAIVAKIAFLNAKFEPFFATSKVYPLLLSSGEFIMDMKSITSDVALPSDLNSSLETNSTKENQ